MVVHHISQARKDLVMQPLTLQPGLGSHIHVREHHREFAFQALVGDAF
jgi:hypothetical protein